MIDDKIDDRIYCMLKIIMIDDEMNDSIYCMCVCGKSYD
jgi:hypothetical protein